MCSEISTPKNGLSAGLQAYSRRTHHRSQYPIRVHFLASATTVAFLYTGGLSMHYLRYKLAAKSGRPAELSGDKVVQTHSNGPHAR
jgi:hypothetical protein